MIEVITPDLSWLETIHDSDEVDSPMTILPGRAVLPPEADGRRLNFVIEHPYALALSPMLDVVVRGEYGTVPALPPTDILENAVKRFWLAPLGNSEMHTLDGLIRWCQEAPKLRLKVCDACKGTMLDTERRTHPEDPTLVLSCQSCDGAGLITRNYKDTLGSVGPFHIDRLALLRVLQHLHGENAAMCIGGMIPGEPMDIHVRQVRKMDGDKAEWGDWRICMQPVVVDTPQKLA